jgi:competence protein ComEA
LLHVSFVPRAGDGDNVEPARARTLPVVLVVVAGFGVLARWPGAGQLPAPCARPALRDGLVVCDGEGRDVADRAWLFGRKLDVNTATAADLERIPGIGRGLAGRIVDERARRGRFTRLDELDDVDGIGPKMLAKLATLVEVR